MWLQMGLVFLALMGDTPDSQKDCPKPPETPKHIVVVAGTPMIAVRDIDCRTEGVSPVPLKQCLIVPRGSLVRVTQTRGDTARIDIGHRPLKDGTARDSRFTTIGGSREITIGGSREIEIPADSLLTPEDALGHFTEALDKQPNNLGAAMGKANALYIAGEFDRSLQEIDRALKVNPESPVLLLLRSQIFTIVGKPGEAIKDCERILARQPDFELPWVNLARACEARNDFQKGIEVCNRAQMRSPSSHATGSLRAFLKARSGDRRGATFDLGRPEKKFREDFLGFEDRLIETTLPLTGVLPGRVGAALSQMTVAAPPHDEYRVEIVGGDIATDTNVFPEEAEKFLAAGVSIKQVGLPRLSIGLLSLLDKTHLSPGLQLLRYSELAEAHEQLGEFEEAIRVVEETLPLAEQMESACSELIAPEQTTAGLLSLRARCQLFRGDFAAAEADSSEALARDDNLTEALLTRCLSRLKAGRTGFALADSKRLLEIAPFDYRTHLVKGLVLVQNSEADEAALEMNKAVVLANSSRETRAARTLQAAVNVQQGRLQSAERDVEAVLAMASRRSEWLTGSIRATGGAGKYNVLSFRIARVLVPEFIASHFPEPQREFEDTPPKVNRDLWSIRSRIAELSGDSEKAFQWLAEIDQSGGSGLDPTIQRAELLRRLQRPAEALAAYDRLLWADESHSVLLRLRGAVYADLGETDKALADFAAAIEHARTDAQLISALVDRNEFSASHDNPKGAIEDLDRAVKLTSSDPRLFITRAGLWKRLGDDAKAAADMAAAASAQAP